MPRLFPKMAKRLLWLAVGPLTAGCATPNSQPYYALPSNAEASVRPAIIEGALEQIRTRNLPFRPHPTLENWTVDRVCAYVFSVDGQPVGNRADCTAAIPLSAGKHAITASLAGTREGSPDSLLGSSIGYPRNSFVRAKATLTFEAEEGHHYRISMDGVSTDGNWLRARVWVDDATTRTRVTEATLLTSPPDL